MGRQQTFHQSHENFGSSSNITATEEVVEEVIHGQVRYQEIAPAQSYLCTK